MGGAWREEGLIRNLEPFDITQKALAAHAQERRRMRDIEIGSGQALHDDFVENRIPDLPQVKALQYHGRGFIGLRNGLVDGGKKSGVRERFVEDIAGPALNEVTFIHTCHSRAHDHGKLGKFAADQKQEILTIQVRHADIEEDTIRPRLFNPRQNLFSFRTVEGFIARFPQEARHLHEEGTIIIHDQDLCFGFFHEDTYLKDNTSDHFGNRAVRIHNSTVPKTDSSPIPSSESSRRRSHAGRIA